MKRLLTLLLLLTAASCNAQHNNMNRTEQCGGYRSNQHETKPIDNVQGTLTSLYCTFHDMMWYGEPSFVRYDIKLDDKTFAGTIAREQGYDSYKFDIPNDAKTTEELTKALKQSGLLKFNTWNVYVNGLPPTTDFYISAQFSSGEKMFMEFNGGHCPSGFMDAVKVFNEAVRKAADYSPDKCPPTKPYVSPYLGEHRFIYQKDGRRQEFKFAVENSAGHGDNAEVLSTGDFGMLHARCSARNVTGRYFFSILSYYDDSQITTPKPNSLAGILSTAGGKIYLEPLQAAPKLPDRNLIQEQK